MNETRRELFRAAVGMAARSSWRIVGAKDTVRIGVIGVGVRCSYLLDLVRKSRGAQIVALSDIYETRREAARHKLAPKAREYLDYRELLDQKDIDAVIIGTPDHWHVRMILDAVDAGKDVYVEKPVSHTIEEGELLQRSMADSEHVAQVGYQQRSWDHYKVVRQVVASRKLGKIALVLCSWYQDYLTLLGGCRKWTHKECVGSVYWARLRNSHSTHYGSLRGAGSGILEAAISPISTTTCVMSCSGTWGRIRLAWRRQWEVAALLQFECPDTINAVIEYPRFKVVYNGSLVGHWRGATSAFAAAKE